MNDSSSSAAESPTSDAKSPAGYAKPLRRPHLRNTETRWGAPAKLLHWTIALLVFAQLPLGLAAVNWALSPTKLDLYVWHKSTGLLILAMMIARIAWRLVNVAPALPDGMPSLERTAARWSHALLYLLLVLLPITGWIIQSASNIPFRVFWTIPLPAIVGPDKAVADAFGVVHTALVVVLSLLLLAHIGAALRHHFVRRNDVLLRMLPGRGGVE